MQNATGSVPDVAGREVDCAAPSQSKEVTSVSELNALAHTLAYEFAVSVIDGDSVTMWDGDDERWSQVDAEGEVDLFDCLRYLDARGLVERHLDHPDWVRVRDESEAAVSIQRLSDEPPCHSIEKDGWQRHPQSAQEWNWKEDHQGDSSGRSERRLNFAMDLSDPHAPDQMALVLRIDLLRLHGRMISAEAYKKLNVARTLPVIMEPRS